MNSNRAIAKTRGGNGYPNLCGTAIFEQIHKGVLMTVKVKNLPENKMCNGGIFALHIHEGESCMGNAEDGFANALQILRYSVAYSVYLEEFSYLNVYFLYFSYISPQNYLNLSILILRNE